MINILLITCDKHFSSHYYCKLVCYYTTLHMTFLYWCNQMCSLHKYGKYAQCSGIICSHKDWNFQIISQLELRSVPRLGHCTVDSTVKKHFFIFYYFFDDKIMRYWLMITSVQLVVLVSIEGYVWPEWL